MKKFICLLLVSLICFCSFAENKILENNSNFTIDYKYTYYENEIPVDIFEINNNEYIDLFDEYKYTIAVYKFKDFFFVCDCKFSYRVKMVEKILLIIRI